MKKCEECQYFYAASDSVEPLCFRNVRIYGLSPRNPWRKETGFLVCSAERAVDSGRSNPPHPVVEAVASWMFPLFGWKCGKSALFFEERETGTGGRRNADEAGDA